MATKPGFMMYHDDCRALGALTDASFRRVIEGMLRYSETGEEPELPEATERVVFGLMRNKIDADDIRYQRRVEAGRKGGIAKASNAKQNLAKSSNSYQDLANLPTTTPTTTPSTTPNPTTTPTGNSSNSYAREGEEEFPPSVERVEQVIQEKGLDVDAREFLARCEANDWKDGMGRRVINWRTWLTGYALKGMRPDRGGAARLQADPRLAAFEAMKGGNL